MKNSFWLRHFLMCNRLANHILSSQGYINMNFADLILKQNNGKTANSQMTHYFWIADKFLCELHESNDGFVFENLEEDKRVTINDLAKLSVKELNEMYNKFCIGRLK